MAAIDPAFREAIERDIKHCRAVLDYLRDRVRFPTLDEAIACNEAVREATQASPSADDDDADRVDRALERARRWADPIEPAASIAYEITAAQGFYEGNKRTAVLLACWFIAENTATDPDLLIPPDDRRLGDLLIAATRGEPVYEFIRALAARALAMSQMLVDFLLVAVLIVTVVSRFSGRTRRDSG